MERTNFFDDQHVLADDLNNIESTKIDSIEKHTLALIASGSVVGHIGDNALLPYYTSYPFPIMNIYAGSAITSAGEIIHLAALTQVIKSSTPTWVSSGPGTFFIKLRYAEASGSFKANDMGIGYPTRYTDSYLPVIDAVAPTSADVCLGSFTANASGLPTGAITDLRTFIRARAVDDQTYLSASPIVGHTVVKDHILAKGSGIQTTANPHGTTLSDLGYSEMNLNRHWQDAHTNGIIVLGRDSDTLNSWKGNVISPTASAYISFTPPTPYAIMNVGGTLFSGSIAYLPGTSAPSDGTFWVVADGTNTAHFLPTGSYAFDASDPHKYPAYVKLGLAVVSDSRDNIDSYINMRDMFAVSQADIRADFVEGTSSPLIALSDSVPLISNLDRIRYQLGLLVSNVPANWALPPASRFSQVITYDMLNGSSGGVVNAVVSTADSNNFQDINTNDVLTILGGGSNCTIKALNSGSFVPHVPIQWQVVAGGTGYTNSTTYATTPSTGYARSVIVTTATTTMGSILHNTSFDPIFVSHSITAIAEVEVTVDIGANDDPSQHVAQLSIPAAKKGSVSFMVPPNWYYRTSLALTESVSSWYTTVWKTGGS